MGMSLHPLTRRVLIALGSFVVGYALPFVVSSLGLGGKFLFVLGWPVAIIWVAGNFAAGIILVILFDVASWLFRAPEKMSRTASASSLYWALALLGFLSAIVVLAWRSL